MYLFGPGVGDLKYLADFFDAFLALNEPMERWSAYEKKHRIDFGDIQDGEVDPAPSRSRRSVGPCVVSSIAPPPRLRSIGHGQRLRRDPPHDHGDPATGPPRVEADLEAHARSCPIQMNLRIRPGYLLGETFGVNGHARPPRLGRSAVAADGAFRLWEAFLTRRDVVFHRRWRCLRQRSP